MTQVVSVSQLTHSIKLVLETQFRAIAVKGEISNFKKQTSGHLYFTLKDQDAQISAALFKGNASSLSRLPKDGDQVIAYGELSVYPPRGGYQIIVRELRFDGIGELLLKLHALKEKLKSLGWFDPAHKKPLPKFPKTIGVVTSPTGAVIRDILNVLSRRYSGFHVILNPVKVQGEGAAEEIAQAIKDFNRYELADVLIVGRGGGSLEDLWAFNEEVVAEAIYHSKIPIISAVGHETDYTIADFVADVRAPTPSAAAEIAVSEKSLHLKFLADCQKRIYHTIQHRLKHYRTLLDSFSKQPVISNPYTFLGNFCQKIDTLKEDIDSSMLLKIKDLNLHLLSIRKQTLSLNPLSRCARIREELIRYRRQLDTTYFKMIDSKKLSLRSEIVRKEIDDKIKQKIRDRKEKLYKLAYHLKSIDPSNLLTKGYCILFSEKNNSVILSANQLEPQTKVRLLLHDGQATTTINEVNHEQRTHS